jgi:Uroporphyrinogen decarboxylase (URO-D)
MQTEVIFNPNWWFRNYGIRFDESFYFDRELRMANDVRMRAALYERFGLGEPHSEPRPICGSQHVAGGFVVPALLGVEVRFEENQAPCPVPRNLDRDRTMALRVPEIETTWPMSRWIADMDWLEGRFGRVIGDFNTDGVLNTALQIRGQQFFLDLHEDPELVSHLCGLITETQCRVAEYVRRRTGTCSVAVNRSIVNVDPAIYLHANCSTQMVSPALFRKSLLEYECALAARLRPFGIHHCGNNLHLFAEAYARTGAVFYDVGWGSDVARCSQALPGAFLNLRLSPVRMLSAGAAEVRQDVERLLTAAARTERVGVCCINMDAGTPDANVVAMLEAARSWG